MSTAANLANWNERVAGHTANDGYGIAALVADPDHISDVVAFDRARSAPSTAGRSCTASATSAPTRCRGRSSVPSSPALTSPHGAGSSRSLAERVGVKATFVETELYDAPQHVPEQFDCVYTSVGAINWLPDIAEWGQVMAGFVKPGGQFYIRDTTPCSRRSTMSDPMN